MNKKTRIEKWLIPEEDHTYVLFENCVIKAAHLSEAAYFNTEQLRMQTGEEAITVSRSLSPPVCVCACVFLYLLPTEYQNIHFTSKVRTCLKSEDIFFLLLTTSNDWKFYLILGLELRLG